MNEPQNKIDNAKEGTYDPITGAHWLEKRARNVMAAILLVACGASILATIILQIAILWKGWS